MNQPLTTSGPCDSMSSPPITMPKNRQAGARLLDGRVRILTTIAERYHELIEPAGREGVRGSGGAIPLPPSTYTPSVREFERLLGLLRNERHSVWWHVRAYYVDAEHRLTWFCPKCRGLSHKPEHTHDDAAGRPYVVAGKQHVRVSRHRNANEKKAAKGIVWMAGRWALGSEPMLPDELRVAA